MRRRLVFCILLLILALPAPARVAAAPLPQEAVSIQSLQIEVWPEYDRPAALVIYHITLASSVKLPAELSLRIPASTGGPSAVAEQNANGLFNLEYTQSSASDDWLNITFTTTLPQLQIEYYDTLQPGISASERAYTYRWPGDYPVSDLQIRVQQPRAASGLSLEPPTGVSSTGQDGLTYFEVPLGQVDRGEAFQLDLSYQNPSGELTMSGAFEQVTPVPPSTTSKSLNFPEVLPWVVGGLGLLLIAGGIFWYQRSSRPPAAPSERSRHHRTGEPIQPAGGDAVFCQQCGKKAAAGDAFCRVCGTRLRR